MSPLASQFPHVYNYVNQLFVAASTIAQESTSTAGGGTSRSGEKAHPLSVSSSTGSHSGGSNSDDEGETKARGGDDAGHERNQERAKKSARTVSVSSAASGASTTASTTDTNVSASSQVKALSQEEKDETVKVIVDLLGEEKEEQVKTVLKEKLGAIGQVSRLFQREGRIKPFSRTNLLS